VALVKLPWALSSLMTAMMDEGDRAMERQATISDTANLFLGL
jgi:hypothetical protein